MLHSKKHYKIPQNSFSSDLNLFHYREKRVTLKQQFEFQYRSILASSHASLPTIGTGKLGCGCGCGCGLSLPSPKYFIIGPKMICQHYLSFHHVISHFQLPSPKRQFATFGTRFWCNYKLSFDKFFNKTQMARIHFSSKNLNFIHSYMTTFWF